MIGDKQNTDSKAKKKKSLKSNSSIVSYKQNWILHEIACMSERHYCYTL